MNKRMCCLFLAFVTSLTVCLMGCGNSASDSASAPKELPTESAAEEDTSGGGSDSATDGSSSAESEVAIDLLEYRSLSSNSVAIISADGQVDVFDPESAGDYYHNDGVSEAWWTINNAYSDNTAKAKAKYDNGSTVVIKAPISIIDDTQYLALSPSEGSWFGFGCFRSNDPAGEDVVTPMVFVTNSESAILDLDLDRKDEVLIAGPLNIIEFENRRMLVITNISQIEAV